MKLKDFAAVAEWKSVIESIDRVTGGKFARYTPELELSVAVEDEAGSERRLTLPKTYIHDFLTQTREHAVGELKKLGVEE